MDTILSYNELRTIYEQSTRLITRQISGIRLEEGIILPEQAPTPTLAGEVCTLYTCFQKNAHSSLALCADASIFWRLAQHMMQSDTVTPQDIEDSSKEYFNVLCGHITAALFRIAKVAARFQIPCFFQGWYQPAEQRKSWEIRFTSDREETARLIHYNAPTV